MTSLIGTVEIISRHDESAIAAELYEGLDERHLIDFEQHWRPVLIRGVQEALQRCTDTLGNVDDNLLDSEISRLQLQDFDWRWREKTVIRQGLPQFTSYALEYDGHTQGLMYVESQSHLCRVPSQHGLGLTYIDLVASAPWNREPLVSNPRYRAVGRVLIATAISASFDAGFDGRIGLHSLPQAESFYTHKCGMTDCGQDQQKENLVYFEMTPAQAQAFLDQGSKGENS